MSELMEHRIEIEIPEGYLEEVTATFDVDQETYPAEPYSWGGSRGTETVTYAEFQHCMLGGLKIDRPMLVKMLSEAEVCAIEERVADELADEYGVLRYAAYETMMDDLAHEYAAQN